MYEESIAAQASSPDVLSRGMKLATSNQVSGLEMQARQDGGLLVRAQVRGSGNRVYAVHVAFDPETERVRGYSCTCPAHESWPGMCKHAVATALLFGMTYAPAIAEAAGGQAAGAGSSEGSRAAEAAAGRPGEGRGGATPGTGGGAAGGDGTAPGTGRAAAAGMPASPGAAGGGTAGGSAAAAGGTTRRPARPPHPKPVLRTSPEVERMMRGYADRALKAARAAAGRGPAAAPEGEEPVELTCTIAKGADAYRSRYYDDDMWRLGLKVSRGRTSYVVKHIDELVEAWRTGAVVQYGKNLQFAHRPGAFSAHANGLIEALSGIVDAQRSMFDAREMRNDYYGNGKLSTKTLPLLPAQLADILDLEVGREVVYEYEEEGEGYTDRYGYRHRGEMKKHKATIPVLEQDPRLEVEIAPHEGGGGYHLRIEPAEAECIGGGAHAYLVTTQAACRLSEGFAADLGPFCAAALPAAYPLQVGDESMPAFCASVLPALRKHARLSEPEELEGLMPPEPAFGFRIGLEDGVVSCNATVSYGDAVVGLFDDARPGGPVRDVARELAVQQAVRGYFPLGRVDTPDYDARGLLRGARVFGGLAGPEAADPWFPEDDDAAYYALLHDGLPELSALGEVYLSERLRRVGVRPAPGVRVQAEVAGGVLDLRADSSDLSDAELAAYLDAYKRKQRYVRLDDGDIMRIDGALGRVAEMAAALGVDPGELAGGGVELPANQTLFVDAMLKRAGGVRFDRNGAFRKIVRDFETVADADIPLPAALQAQMRPYQEEGYRWLCVLGCTGFGGILADDMGLGKTLQAIAYFLHARDEAAAAAAASASESGRAQDAGEAPDGAAGGAVPAGGGPTAAAGPAPALVVCPASLVYNWMAELGRFAPTLSAAAVLGAKAERRRIVGAAASADVLVTSYDLLKRDIDLYAPVEFSACVLDEAQYIKNPGTKAAKSVKQVRARARFALTGTPVENRLTELWSIFDFLMPGALGTQEQFARRFSTPIAGGDEAAAQRLQRLVGPFILRRLKGDVLADLPDKNETIVYAQMEGEQAKLYRASASKLARSLSDQAPEEFRSAKLQVLAELTRLRQIACDPHLVFENYDGGSAKLDTCCELVASAVEAGHGVLLFSQFTSMFPLIGERLEHMGVAYLQLTGATSKEERTRLVARFQAGEAPVFLISLKAGGVGLNLTAADIVVHYDPWWNLAAQNQATDRAHRIGQEREVSVFKIIAKDTVEEKIVQMQEAKQDLADSILGGEAVSAASITRDDILALLDAGR